MFLLKAHSSPLDDLELSCEEKKLIIGHSVSKEPVKSISWRLVLSKPPVCALIASHFCYNWGIFILLTWMPTCYNQVLKFDLIESGLFCVLPWLTMAFSTNLGGWIADTLVSRGLSVTVVRKCEMTGVVVDVGDGATHIVHVADGYVIRSSIKSIPVSGKDVTLFVQQLLKERGENIPPEDSFEVARKVKEMYCYTCSDIVKEYNKHDKEPSKYVKQWTGIKPRTGAPYTCDIGYERFMGPEIFFNPEIYNSDFSTPLPAVIDKCIQSAPIDTRRALYKNVVLSGGSTMFKDFHRRLQRDVKKIVDARIVASEARHGGNIKSQPVEVNVVSHPIQRFAVWFGGSVLASTPEFYTACHTKAEYEEYGASICRTNPVFKGMY